MHATHFQVHEAQLSRDQASKRAETERIESLKFQEAISSAQARVHDAFESRISHRLALSFRHPMLQRPLRY